LDANNKFKRKLVASASAAAIEKPGP
jgi:hypothetical protein